jgi:hypothetical protein
MTSIDATRTQLAIALSMILENASRWKDGWRGSHAQGFMGLGGARLGAVMEDWVLVFLQAGNRRSKRVIGSPQQGQETVCLGLDFGTSKEPTSKGRPVWMWG